MPTMYNHGMRVPQAQASDVCDGASYLHSRPDIPCHEYTSHKDGKMPATSKVAA